MSEKEFMELHAQIEQSGESTLACLRARGITKTSYYKWRKTYMSGHAGEPALAPLSFGGTPKAEAGRDTSSGVSQPRSAGGISITLPGGTRIAFPSSLAGLVLSSLSSKIQ